MGFEHIHDNKELLLLQCLSGSKAYGLANPQSDTDVKGVFLLPKKAFYSLSFSEQVSNATNDIVYYELRRFFDLLLKNNPNLLELLSAPEKAVLYKHPIMDRIKPELFISKLCNQTFAGYAYSQIKKAKGLNKKIVNPMDKERKSIVDFCYLFSNGLSVPLKKWLWEKGLDQRDCALASMPHAQNIYALFHKHQSQELKPFGIYSSDVSNDVSLSSVPKGLTPLTYLSFNKDGYSVYCKNYKEYWYWVENRNEARFQNTLENEKNYDTKNMMHTFRLLNMAEEIAVEQRINVFRSDRDFLLNIKAGNFSYEELLSMAEEKVKSIDNAFKKSSLQNQPNASVINDLLIEIRDELYNV